MFVGASLCRWLVECAENDGRVVLTRDMAFMVARYTDQMFYVRSNTKQTQLVEVVTSFKPNCCRESFLSRCSSGMNESCHRVLFAMRTDKIELPALIHSTAAQSLAGAASAMVRFWRRGEVTSCRRATMFRRGLLTL